MISTYNEEKESKKRYKAYLLNEFLACENIRFS